LELFSDSAAVENLDRLKWFFYRRID